MKPQTEVDELALHEGGPLCIDCDKPFQHGGGFDLSGATRSGESLDGKQAEAAAPPQPTSTAQVR